MVHSGWTGEIEIAGHKEVLCYQQMVGLDYEVPLYSHFPLCELWEVDAECKFPFCILSVEDPKVTHYWPTREDVALVWLMFHEHPHERKAQDMGVVAGART